MVAGAPAELFRAVDFGCRTGKDRVQVSLGVCPRDLDLPP